MYSELVDQVGVVVAAATKDPNAWRKENLHADVHSSGRSGNAVAAVTA
jgi:hypothetical protein